MLKQLALVALGVLALTGGAAAEYSRMTREPAPAAKSPAPVRADVIWL
jgi:hypothetical protein